MIIKNGPEEFFDINSAGEIHFMFPDSVSPFSVHVTVSALAPGASSAKLRVNSVGMVRR